MCIAPYLFQLHELHIWGTFCCCIIYIFCEQTHGPMWNVVMENMICPTMNKFIKNVREFILLPCSSIIQLAFTSANQ